MITKDDVDAALRRIRPHLHAGYGYLWWTYAYPYKGRTVRPFCPSGNGSQEVIAIPELDLVIAVYAGNYKDWETGLRFLREHVPKYILPAVGEGTEPQRPR